MEASGKGNHAAAESEAVDVAQVQVADDQRGAAAPCSGQVGQLDG